MEKEELKNELINNYKKKLQQGDEIFIPKDLMKEFKEKNSSPNIIAAMTGVFALGRSAIMQEISSIYYLSDKKVFMAKFSGTNEDEEEEGDKEITLDIVKQFLEILAEKDLELNENDEWLNS